MTRFWLGLGLFCLGGWLGAQANEPVRWNNDVAVEVVTDEGRTLPLYQHSTSGEVYKAYLEAEAQARYSIRVRNNTRDRVGLVIAVDGRNIISGEKSNLRADERMYLLDPGETQAYEGWRTGQDRVNRFFFTEAGDSYAETFGDTSALGVIAVAVYHEKLRRPRRYVVTKRLHRLAWPLRAARAPKRGQPQRKRSRPRVLVKRCILRWCGWNSAPRSSLQNGIFSVITGMKRCARVRLPPETVRAATRPRQRGAITDP